MNAGSQMKWNNVAAVLETESSKELEACGGSALKRKLLSDL